MARKKKPVKLVTLDTETFNGLLGDIKRIAIYDGSTVIYGYSFPDIEPQLKKWAKDYAVHVYIHNMEFDIRKMPELFDGNQIVWKSSVAINGKLAVLKCKDYTLHDSLKLFPDSLYSLSKGFDVECGKLDLWEEVQKEYPDEYTDHVDFLDRCPVDDTLFLKYLGYDVISLYQVLEKAMGLLGIPLDKFVTRLSTASLSRYMFREGYQGKEFITDGVTDYSTLTRFIWREGKKQNNSNTIDDIPCLEIEAKLREAFCGGRTEVFKPILNHAGYHYDVNSLYPSVMIDNYFPVSKPSYHEGEEAQYRWEKWLKSHRGLGFLKCSVYVPEQHIPPLPVKKDKLCFPCGHIRGTWTFPEIEYAVKHCGCEITEYEECILFVSTAKVFHNFVSEFYKIKEKASKEGNKALKTIAKLILNTGYGYTGMRRDDKTSLISIDDVGKYPEEDIITINERYGFAEVLNPIEAEYIQVQVAAYVTSYARLVLLDALRKAQQNGAEVYYCDTDSIVTDKPFPSEIVDGARLGFWDLETTPARGIFLRPKVYAESFDGSADTVKFKGVSRTTQAGFNFSSYEGFLKILQEGIEESIPVEEGKTVLPSLLVLQKNDLSLSTYYTRDKNMNLDTIEKRQIDYNENYTKPWYFGSLEDFDSFDFFKDLPEEITL